MKLYRLDLEITDKDEMHLEVDHYLTPVDITEEKIDKILIEADVIAAEADIETTYTEKRKWTVKAIMQLLTNKTEP